MQRLVAIMAIFVLLGLSLGVQAQEAPPRHVREMTGSGGSGMALLNLDNTVALHGHDPVAYFEEGEARRGNKRIVERVGGATYYFASRGSRYEFLSDANKYQPQFGGFCAWSMAQGRLADIDPDIFLIYQGKLYLFQDAAQRAAFQKNPTLAIRNATQNYFEIALDRRRHY